MNKSTLSMNHSLRYQDELTGVSMTPQRELEITTAMAERAPAAAKHLYTKRIAQLTETCAWLALADEIERDDIQQWQAETEATRKQDRP